MHDSPCSPYPYEKEYHDLRRYFQRGLDLRHRRSPTEPHKRLHRCLVAFLVIGRRSITHSGSEEVALERIPGRGLYAYIRTYANQNEMIDSLLSQHLLKISSAECRIACLVKHNLMRFRLHSFQDLSVTDPADETFDVFHGTGGRVGERDAAVEVVGAVAEAREEDGDVVCVAD